MQLLPHQLAFVEVFFDPASKRVILLRADVGLGKSTALVALVTRLLRQRPTAKVLLLAPGALRVWFVEQLRSAGIPALSVDRYQFREMIESAAGQELWPAGAVSVLTREFARQEDIGQALGATHWDLLIVDEAHQFQGALTGRVLRYVAETSDRVVLATSTLLSLDLPGSFANDDITVVQWRRDQIVDFNGDLLDSMPRPFVRLVPFTLSTAELSLAETVSELCQVFQTGTTQQHLIARLLLQSLQSSPAALENVLTRIRESRNRIAHGMPWLESPEEEQLEDQGDGSVDLNQAEKAKEIASRALDALETAGSDSKLAGLVALLRHIDALKSSAARICVLTEYLGTLFYLAAEIESRGKTCHVFHGGMDAEERQRTLARFKHDGGILAANRAAMSEGVALSEVTDLVMYDIPGSPAALERVVARVDRFGRQTQLNIHVLVPSNGVGSFAESLESLRHVFGARGFSHGEWPPNVQR
jgi:ERCC4-related helicase